MDGTRGQPDERLTGWARIEDLYKDLDEKMVDGFKNDIDTLLVFAGLFSAVVTAFLMQSNGLLQVDNSQRTVELLAQLVALQIGNSSNQSAVQATSFTPSSPSILINTLWYLTLVLSLASALFGMMAKQWLREYMQWTTMSTLPVNAVFLRQLRYQTFVDWKTPGILACIPVLLEVAVVLFSVGMVIHLFTLNAIVAGVSTVAVAIMLALTFLSLILPVSFPRCPYKSSAGWSLVLLARSCASLWSTLMSRMSLISEAGSNSGIGSSGALAQPPVKDWRTRDLELHPRDGFEGEISQLYNHIVPPHAPDAPDAPDMLQFSREATRIYALSCALLWIQETSQDGQLLATVDDCYKMRNLPTLQADISGDELMVDFLLVCDRLYVPVKAMHAYLHAMYRADFAMNPPADFLVTQDSSPPCDVEAKIFGNPMMIRAVLGNILSGTVLQSLSRPSPRTSNGLGRTNTLVVNSLLLCGHIISPQADLSAQTQIVRRTCMDNFQNIFGLLSKNKGLCQKLPGVRSILFHFMFEWKERRVTSLGQRFGQSSRYNVLATLACQILAGNPREWSHDDCDFFIRVSSLALEKAWPWDVPRLPELLDYMKQCVEHSIERKWGNCGSFSTLNPWIAGLNSPLYCLFHPQGNRYTPDMDRIYPHELIDLLGGCSSGPSSLQARAAGLRALIERSQFLRDRSSSLEN